MGKRICIIGNSHITALKQAWDGDPSSLQPYEPTFFGSFSFQMTDLKFENGRFFAGSDVLANSMMRTSDGLNSFETKDFDAFVLIGLGLRFKPDLYYSTHRLVEDADDRTAPISPACLAEMVAADVKNNLAARIVSNIRSVSGAPVIFSPVPLPSVEFLNADNVNIEWLRLYRKAVLSGIGERLYPFFANACNSLANQLNAIFLNQPARTTKRGCCSKTAYSRLVAPGGEPDFLHMNADYGRLMLKQIRWNLGKTREKTTASEQVNT